MKKSELVEAIKTALREHQANLEAVKTAEVPSGLEHIVISALSNALTAKLTRLFDPQ